MLIDVVVEIAYQLKLLGLSLDQFGVGGGKQADRFPGEVGGCHFGGSGHQEVPGEDGHCVGPVGVDRVGPASGLRLIDDIVVI